MFVTRYRTLTITLKNPTVLLYCLLDLNLCLHCTGCLKTIGSGFVCWVHAPSDIPVCVWLSSQCGVLNLGSIFFY